jgi:hypothetical protein
MPILHQSTDPKAPLLSPFLLVRGFPCVAAILVALAMAFSKSEDLHSIFLGGALGILIGCTAFSFSIKSITLKQTEQPSDVQRYPLT